MTSDMSAASAKTKPMRLGTKSCVECRRRKVRCIFATADATRCRQCLLHKIKCVPQGLPRHDLGENTTSPENQTWQPNPLTPPDLKDYPRLKAVLDNISSPLAFATSQSGHTADASPPDELVERCRLLAYVLETLLADESDKLALHRLSEHPRESRREHSEGDIVFTSAPLLTYLQSTVLGAFPGGNKTLSSSPGPPVVGALIRDDLIWRKTVLSLIPDPKTLETILELTKPYWSIWPLSHMFPDSVPEALTFIDRDLRDPDIAARVHPGPAAKRLVWLALCLQQLPSYFYDAHREAFTAHKPSELVQKLLNVATDLVHSSCEVAKPDCTLAALEALAIAYKCYMNMGRPRQGWKCSRLGIDNALLMGLHRLRSYAKENPASDQRRRAIWTALWSHDRQMALFMGIPYAVPEHFIEFQVSQSPGDVRVPHLREQNALGRMMIISGHIVDRDQAASASYADTVRIEEEIEATKNMIPIDDWLLGRIDLGNQPIGLPFWRRTTIFFHHYMNHLLHLPFAVRGMRESKYQHSRQVALVSAEGMLVAFQNTPTGNNGLPVVCDWLDFAAFSGAMALVLDLLETSSNSGVQEDQNVAFSHLRTAREKQRLWVLVMQFASDMRRKCELLDCRVSRQAAEVLEHLYAVQKGAYSAPERYEVVIPYFGRVCIKRPQFRDRDSHISDTTRITPSGFSPHTAVNSWYKSQEVILDDDINAKRPDNPDNSQSTFVEFDLTTYGCGRQPWLGDMDFELGEDWTTASSTFDLNEVNWSQVFEFETDAVNMNNDMGQ